MSSLIAQQCGNPWNSCIQGSVFQPWLRVQRALLHTTEVGGKIQTLHDDQPIRVLLRGIQDDPRYHADGARFPQLNSSKSTALFTQFAQFSPSLLQVPDLNGSLSGRWFQLLWKIWKSVWIIIPNIGKVIKFMFQTTNQQWIFMGHPNPRVSSSTIPAARSAAAAQLAVPRSTAETGVHWGHR